MSNPVLLRDDYNAAGLRRLARAADDPAVRSRLLGIATIYDGCSRTEASNMMGVGRQIVRDWVLRFNDQGPGGLRDGKRGGVKNPSVLGEILKNQIATLVCSAKFQKGRRLDQAAIRAWLETKHRVVIAARVLNDELQLMRKQGLIPELDYTSPRVYSKRSTEDVKRETGE